MLLGFGCGRETSVDLQTSMRAHNSSSSFMGREGERWRGRGGERERGERREERSRGRGGERREEREGEEGRREIERGKKGGR